MSSTYHTMVNRLMFRATDRAILINDQFFCKVSPHASEDALVSWMIRNDVFSKRNFEKLPVMEQVKFLNNLQGNLNPFDAAPWCAW